MGVTGETQLWNFLYACGLGFWLGLYYELFRTVRLLLPPTAKGCFFQDVFFCLSAALITFFTFLAIADGQMVPYLFIGEIIGFFAFYCTIGRIFHTLLAALLRRLARAIRTLWRWISRPISRWFGALFGRQSRITAVPRRFISEKIQKLRKKFNFFSKKT